MVVGYIGTIFGAPRKVGTNSRMLSEKLILWENRNVCARHKGEQLKPGNRKTLGLAGGWINRLGVQASFHVLGCATNGTGYESLLGWPFQLLYPLLEWGICPPTYSILEQSSIL